MSDRIRFNLILWPSVAVFAIGAFCFCFFMKSDYSMVGWMNAFFYGGGIVFLSGSLWLVARFGAFSMITYGVRDLFWHMNPRANKKEKKYEDYTDYVTQKREERKRKHFDFFWPFLSLGGAMIVVSLILYLVYQAQIAG